MNKAARAKADPWGLLGILDAVRTLIHDRRETFLVLQSQTLPNRGPCEAEPSAQKGEKPGWGGVHKVSSQKAF